MPPTVAITSFTKTVGQAVVVTGTGGRATGDLPTVTVVLCLTNATTCATADVAARLTATVGTTGAWTVTSGNLNKLTVYARATQADSSGNVGSSAVAGPVSP